MCCLLLLYCPAHCKSTLGQNVFHVRVSVSDLKLHLARSVIFVVKVKSPFSALIIIIIIIIMIIIIRIIAYLVSL